jgi:16S rRNA (guanine527-N7)-methyltransferase
MTEQLREYFELLSRWNKKINLVSNADDFDAFVFEHVEDALRMHRHLEGAKSLLDLGTGAGIPGILIKLDMPELRVVLLDSIRKKISFCEEAIRRLGLKDIDAVTGRAEDEAVIQALGRFDAIVSRATWKLSDYLHMARPYMHDSGSKVIAMKGMGWREELSGARDFMAESGLRLLSTDEYDLADGRRHAMLVLAARQNKTLSGIVSRGTAGTFLASSRTVTMFQPPLIPLALFPTAN